MKENYIIFLNTPVLGYAGFHHHSALSVGILINIPSFAEYDCGSQCMHSGLVRSFPSPREIAIQGYRAFPA